MKLFSVNLFKKIFISVSVAICVLFLYTPQANALDCINPEPTYIALYENGNFIDGFSIKRVNTGNVCDTRPVVVTNNTAEVERVLNLAKKTLNKDIGSGIYELKTFCCGQEDTLRFISNGIEPNLEKYKQEWLNKEAREIQNVYRERDIYPVIFISILLLIIAFPWILIFISLKFKRSFKPIFLISIFLKGILFVIAKSVSDWAYNEWQVISSISIYLILGSTFLEILYLLISKNKPKK